MELSDEHTRLPTLDANNYAVTGRGQSITTYAFTRKEIDRPFTDW